MTVTEKHHAATPATPRPISSKDSDLAAAWELRAHAKGWRTHRTRAKIISVKGWPTMVIDEAVIHAREPDHLVKVETERGSTSYREPMATSAIEVVDDLIGFDVDVLSPEQANGIADLILDHFEGIDGKVLLRDTTHGAKLLILARSEKPFGIWKSPTFEGGGEKHVVEVYGGGATRYFCANGPHTQERDENGKFWSHKDYRWDEAGSPLDTSPGELAVIGMDALDKLLGAVVTYMKDVAGWSKRDEYVDGNVSSRTVFDLTPDMVFETRHGESLSFDDAEAYAASERDARCAAMPEWGGTGKDRTRCRMWCDDGVLRVMDYAQMTMHRPEGTEDEVGAGYREQLDAEQQASLLMTGELLKQIGLDLGEGSLFAPRDPEAEHMERRLQKVAPSKRDFYRGLWWMQENFLYDMSSGYIFDASVGGGLRVPLKERPLKTKFHAASYTEIGARGGEKRVEAFDAWMVGGSDRTNIYGVRFDPRTTNRLFAKEGLQFANTFKGMLPGVDDRPAAKVLDRFIDHLIPDDEEREWFWDWLAAKYQEPWTRNCSVLMVAAGQSGTGRSTLFEIVDKMCLGQTQPVGVETLLGKGPSAGRNDHMEDNLFVFCDEVSGVSFADRKNGAERLKDLFDPKKTSISVDRKHLPAYKTETYATGLWATNHINALHIDVEDRRIAVITNTQTKLDHRDGGGLADQMFNQIGLDRLAAALAWKLEQRTVVRRVFEAPHFAGREEMIEAGFTEVSDAIRAVADEAPPNKVWRRVDFEKSVGCKMGSPTGKGVTGVRQEVGKLQGQRAERMGVTLLQKRFNVGQSRSQTAVVAKNEAVAIFCAAGLEERAEMLDAPTGVAALMEACTAGGVK